MLSPDTLQTLLPLPSLFPEELPISGLVSIVQSKLSPSPSVIVTLIVDKLVGTPIDKSEGVSF